MLSVFGTYMCWQAQEEERHIRAVVTEYMRVKAREEGVGRELSEPLLPTHREERAIKEGE